LLFAAYALFLVLSVWAFTRIAAGRLPKHEGSPWRPITLVISMASLLLFLTLVPQQEGATSIGTLIVGAGVAGSALYAIGAAIWTGIAAYRLRALGWVLTGIAFGIPSTLTLGAPLLALLAFPLAPISRYGVRERHTGSAAA
jgi:hypothetical protein